jgi:hypothetical protein
MKKFFVGVVVAAGVVGVLWAAFYPITNNKVVIGYNQGYEPTQPIAFSHKLHAGTNQIDCRYCHTGTEVSRHASVPSLNVCMNCHIQVRTDSPEIQKLTEAYKTGKSVAWEKVHLLPDHVKFNHAMHIKAGKQCVDCHGNVAEMEKIKQVKSLAMGWCVNCHRLPENHAPTNCSTCHY